MLKLIVVLAFSLILLNIQCSGYRMTRCQLVRELVKHGFPRKDLRDWYCLVNNESARKTDVIGKPNTDGSRDYGLFQINDHWWCSNTTTPGKDCHVTCADLITNDITKAAKCAQKIFQIQGFLAWHGWEKHCQGTLPRLPVCKKRRH